MTAQRISTTYSGRSGVRSTQGIQGTTVYKFNTGVYYDFMANPMIYRGHYYPGLRGFLSPRRDKRRERERKKRREGKLESRSASRRQLTLENVLASPIHPQNRHRTTISIKFNVSVPSHTSSTSPLLIPSSGENPQNA